MPTPARLTPAPLDSVGHWLAPLGLRLILAWEFFESGREKLQGANWFAQLDDRFPWPFSVLGANLNWSLATWFELLGSLALLLGLGTRLAAYSLWVLSIVATYAVHWPGAWASLGELWQGYAITNKGFGNYKLPLLYLVMLLPLMLNGAGRFSLDQLIGRHRLQAGMASGPWGWSATLVLLGLPLALLLPWVGAALFTAGLAVLLAALRPR
ncbi:DoxX family membrane protein [Bordetella sp. BOR01]|uniref:HvfX family Cu-binding RiPP maturation protein n=1 Tax=Bordetella sp. BOR01 TaxID=2854779 RepID=UPI001C443806|nr:DoxX family membrane protein [Bordetella sp. BOR01]MBV7483105.1 DoxX family membrane protein [Bordetella sp. BOR01]